MAESAEEALAALLETTVGAAPGAVVLRMVDPLVTVSDIAEDAGVTRQAVRNWALGTRHSGFPKALDIVGDGVRVWRQADVDPWLTAAVNLGSGHCFPDAAFILEFNERLSAPEDETAGAWQVASRVTETQTESTELRPAQSANRAPSLASRR